MLQKSIGPNPTPGLQVINNSSVILTDEIQDYTVYKSKNEFKRLQIEINNNQLVVSIINGLIFIAFGIVDLVIVILCLVLGSAPSVAQLVLDITKGNHPIDNTFSPKENLQSNIFGISKNIFLISWVMAV